jgi:hypothetical protein
MRRVWILGFAMLAGLLTATPRADALAQHTWVAAEGSDSNAGTRYSPFASLAEAVRETAAGGEISVAETGDYGSCTITQSVTIDGGGARAALTPSATSVNGIVIENPAAAVILRRLDLNGGTNGANGIVVYSAQSLMVDDCSITGYETGLAIQNTGAENVAISNTNITCSYEGIEVYGSPSSRPHITLSKCVIGQASLDGLNVQNATLDVSDSSIVQCGYGIFASHGTISVVGCTLSGNGTAVDAYAGGAIQLSNASLLNNNIAIAITGGSVTTVHNNVSIGNTTSAAPNASGALF